MSVGCVGAWEEEVREGGVFFPVSNGWGSGIGFGEGAEVPMHSANAHPAPPVHAVLSRAGAYHHRLPLLPFQSRLLYAGIVAGFAAMLALRLRA